MLSLSCLCNVLSLSQPHFQNWLFWNTVQNGIIIILSDMKRSGQGKKVTITWSILKLSEISKDKHLKDYFYIMLSEIKRSHCNKKLQLLCLNWTADFSWHSLSNTVSYSQTVLWLACEPLNRRISIVTAHRHTRRWTYQIVVCWPATFVLKIIFLHFSPSWI